MRFYIVDDDINIILILKNIIEKHNLGVVIGYETDSISAVEEILEDIPDIILVDYLMPKLDGNSLIKMVSKKYPKVRFIMISQVSDANLKGEVYNSGVEFFIQKPINVIEVKSVIESVIEIIALTKKFETLKRLISDDCSKDPACQENNPNEKNGDLETIKRILSDLAVLGEKGAVNLIEICEGKLNAKNGCEFSIGDYSLGINENAKIVKQRVRRAILVGLRNLAHIGIEDNLNEYFLKYANKLYDYRNIWLEMEWIRGHRKTGGRVNVDKFIENLMLLSKYSE
ncbi:DNA-binding domain-containing protein [Fusibacter ferrireducens]|uniref:Stage 0 sporulation protein A homolog n=1 Tax=Fusibacter ferrireducens TaxID=2785058 RepID=A0ABR9ZM67_9FIRM|nr:DNA-binding domain-containing protein [Fusibacter ferrireducens]MBF4691568.1 DNA-binding domain-containing protein [Fusibacter ferrireducens]